ncbi:MAG: hypothetical protein ABIJ57_13810 [Pseudomonadota bacterium]
MQTYRVKWEIDVEAETPQKAAEEAKGAQLDPESIATIFNVTDRETGETVEIELQ